MTRHHFVVLSFPAQGHVNPNLQLCNRLLQIGVRVTFVTSTYARILLGPPTNHPEGLTFVEYNDGYDGKSKTGKEADQMIARSKLAVSEALRQVVSSAADEGCPVTCVTYSLLLPWVAAVARELHVQSAFVWIQAATMFDVYYYYNHGFDAFIHEKLDDKQEPSSATLKLPGLPLEFTSRDVPSYMSTKNRNAAANGLFSDHMAELDVGASTAIVIVNTFDALEPEALKCISKLKLTAVGPLIQPAPYDTSNNNNSSHVSWLDSKPDSSVIYVSFGSMKSVLSSQQMEEIGRGLLDLGKPFLWVVRELENKSDDDEKNVMSCMEELEQLGLMVPWCSQLQVLSHPAIGCFFTHCGWNSTMEGLISGVPMVAFPQLFDQFTNAKLVEDYWKVGVRVNQNLSDGLVERNEIKRCLEVVMGDVEMRQNTMKWKKLAVEAVKEGGSSDKNLKGLVNNLVTC
ncbi:hypothetical protein QQ045_024645 [Rhodiola kirilowii]